MGKKFNPLVSIVIPVFNGSNFMREAIDSALAQTYDNIEIIVVNDGSTDNTDEIAKSYGNKVRYFKKENGGTSTALNIGIRNMKGEYFSWLSHDDMYYPNKIKRQIEELEKLDNKNTIMMSDLDGINEKYKKIYRTSYIEHIRYYPPREKSYIHPIIYNQTHGCTLLIPKVCFDKVGLFDEKALVAQDFELFYRIFSKFPHKLIPEILVTARDSSQRQGIRSKVRGSLEYSNLFICIMEALSEDEFKLLAPNKLDFYLEMQGFFKRVGYTNALNYVNKQIIKNLQISSYDLIGNKFNGHNLHLDLRSKNLDSRQMVLHKQSNDEYTYSYDFYAKNAIKELIQQKIFLESNLIHLHLIHNFFDVNYLPIISRLKPTIMTLHDPFFLAGHCVHHFDCEKWKTHCQDCPYLNEMFSLDHDYSALNFELKKQAIQNSQITAIVASRWMERKVKESPIWQGKKVYRLPFGIDQKIFRLVDINGAKQKLDISNDSVTLMFRADSGSYKGLDIIKNALEKLKSTKRVTLIAVGNKGLLKGFENKFNIIQYNWINNDALLASLYQACDLFLMPSRQETFGMMAIEAMSCGKMVLALNCEGSALPEIVNSPISSLAVDEKDYAKELQRLMKNTDEIRERGKKSLDFAQKKYNKDIYVKKIIEIYKEVIDNHHLDDSSKLTEEQLEKYATREIGNPNNIINRLTISILSKIDYQYICSMYRIPRYVLKTFYGEEVVKDKYDKIFRQWLYSIQ